jgi:hypothetical protein
MTWAPLFDTAAKLRHKAASVTVRALALVPEPAKKVIATKVGHALESTYNYTYDGVVRGLAYSMKWLNPQRLFPLINKGQVVSMHIDPDGYLDEGLLHLGVYDHDAKDYRPIGKTMSIKKKDGLVYGLVLSKWQEKVKDSFGERVLDTHLALLLTNQKVVVVSSNDWFRKLVVVTVKPI